MGAPKVGSGVERFIFPTASRAAPTGMSTPLGLRIGQARPAASNSQNGATVVVRGGFWPSRASYATDIVITIMSPGIGPATPSRMYAAKVLPVLRRALSSDRAAIDDIIQTVAVELNRFTTEQFSPTVRYGVDATGSGVPLGVTTHFTPWKTAIAVPNDLDGPPAMMVGPDARLYIATLTTSSGVPSSLRVWRHDSAVDDTVQLVQTISDYRTATGIPSDMPDVTLIGADWFVLNGRLCLAVASQLFTAGIIHFWEWSPAMNHPTGGLRLVSPAGKKQGLLVLPYSFSADGGGVAACEADGSALVAAAVYMPNDLQLQQGHSVVLLRSPDLMTWGCTQTSQYDFSFPCPETRALGDFFAALAAPSTTVSAIRFFTDGSGARIGIAVTQDGMIYRSTDGGRSWTEIPSPVSRRRMVGGRSIPLHAIAALPHGTGAEVFAAGDRSTLLQSLDGGVTWRVVLSAESREAFSAGDILFTSPGIARPQLGFSRTLRALAVIPQDPNTQTYRLLAAGDGGLLLGCQFTVAPDTPLEQRALASPVTLLDFNSPGTYMAMARTGAQGVVEGFVYLAGSATVHDIQFAGHTQARRVSRFLRLPVSACLGSAKLAPTNAALTYFLGAPAIDSARSDTVVGLSMLSDSVGYAADVAGHVYTWTGSTWNWLAQISEAVPRDMLALSASTGVIADAQNAVYLSNSLATPESVAFTKVSTPIPAMCLAQMDASTYAIGGVGGIAFTQRQLDNRTAPCLLRLPSGTVLLAVTNLDRGMCEIYRMPGGRGMWELVDTQIRFPPPSDPKAYAAAQSAPRVRMALDVTGDVLAVCSMCGANGTEQRQLVSPADSDGREWWDGADPRLGLPLGKLAPTTGNIPPSTTATLLRRTRTFCVYKGRLLTAYRNSGSSSFTIEHARIFATGTASNPTHFVPVIPSGNVEQPTGVDDIRVVFRGLPVPGDVFTLSPEYRFGKHRLAARSPQITARAPTGSAWSFWWDAADVAVQRALGASEAGPHLPVSAFALFNTNFPTCRFETMRVSDTGVEETTTFTASAAVASITIAPVGRVVSGNVSTNVVRVVSGASGWVPGQWASGNLRNWFLLVGTVAARIVESTADGYLFLHRTVTLAATQQSAQIYGDRIIWLGSGGTGPGSGGLRDSVYKFAKTVTVVVPSGTPSPDPYYEVGAAVLGIEPPVPAGERGYRWGFSWDAVISSVQAVSPSNIKTVRHFGRPAQVWSLQWGPEDLPATDRKLNAMLVRQRDPFVILFDGANPQSAELVAISEWKFQNVVFNYTLTSVTLEEVL